MPLNGLANPRFDRPTHHVGDNRVGPYHPKEIRPPSVPSIVEDPAKHQEPKKTDAATPQRPTRCPNPLDQRADPQGIQGPSPRKTYPCRCQKIPIATPHLRVFSKPIARQKPHEHRSESRDKTQRAISTPGIEVSFFTRKQIHPPCVKCPSRIAVFVPVGSKTRGMVLPCIRYTHARVIKLRRWQRVERKEKPIRNQYAEDT